LTVTLKVKRTGMPKAMRSARGWELLMGKDSEKERGKVSASRPLRH
jgi:hypothetical protein